MTWIECERAKESPAFRGRFCAAFCVAAEIMQLLVAYLVLALSMTVIIRAEKVSEVVFNGLVITFLTDLDEYAFQACCAIFHFDARQYNKFKFQLIKHASIAKEIEIFHEEG